jgi:5'-3' exonuclease
MVELEADDALASAADQAFANPRVAKVCIWTPDKDLAQCVRGQRVVQIDRRTQQIRDETGVRQKYGVGPTQIPDFLALVGDAADGYPGIKGIGRVSASRLLDRYGPLEFFPPEVLGQRKEEALLFKTLATLRTDAHVFDEVEELRWLGPTNAFGECARLLGDDRLIARAAKALLI